MKGAVDHQVWAVDQQGGAAAEEADQTTDGQENVDPQGQKQPLPSDAATPATEKKKQRLLKPSAPCPEATARRSWRRMRASRTLRVAAWNVQRAGFAFAWKLPELRRFVQGESATEVDMWCIQEICTEGRDTAQRQPKPPLPPHPNKDVVKACQVWRVRPGEFSMGPCAP